VPGEIVDDCGKLVSSCFEQAKREFTSLTQESVRKLYFYKVPKLAEGGSCSIKNELEEFNLNTICPGSDISEKELQTHSNTLRIYALNLIVEKLHQDLDGVDWLGIYRKVVSPGSTNSYILVKEAYKGSESRGLFPLTDQFAEQSNNSWVGINGKGKLIQDIRKYSGPYYECNSKVLSELCVPIFDEEKEQGEVIGIIDVESHQTDYFTPKKVLIIAQVCYSLGLCKLGF